MDYSDVLGKLSYLGETDPDSSFSLARLLSLPLDFLALLVKNRREAELLLNVSRCAANLDVLMQNYEMIASRAQGLQQAWNGLWLSHEPYIVPAIPMIGTAMSGINSGRCVLVEKMHTEMQYLQELGRQLCHYIDVNFSLVEELRMEGIDRLAINKLFLVEVEKELAKRITCIGNNESMNGFSTIRQFLRELTRNPVYVSMTQSADIAHKEPADMMTNGSCSTEKATTDGVSEPSGNRDVLSPDSQSFASKCVTTQAENRNSLLHTGIGGKPLAMEQFQEMTVGLTTTSIPSRALASGGDINVKLDVHNQCSSASEEILPKLSITNGLYESPPTSIIKPVADMGMDSAQYMNMSHRSIDRMLHVRLQGQMDYRCRINYENPTSETTSLLKDAVQQRSSVQIVPVDDQIYSQPFQNHGIDLKHESRKRPFESNGGTAVEEMAAQVRQSKRILLQAVSEPDGVNSGKASSFQTIINTGTIHKNLGTCQVPVNDSCKASESSMEGRCRDCGCLPPQAFMPHGRSLFNLSSSCNPDDDLAVESSCIHASESPLLATQ